VCGPESGHIDGAYTYHDDKQAPPFEMEKWVEHLASEILRDLGANDMHVLKYLVRHCLTQAKEHCDECHGDIREKLAAKLAAKE
jgi:hypothetical protein